MICRIAKLRTQPDLKLRVSFDDGRTVVYDVADDVASLPSFAPLAEVEGLFMQAALDPSRTCVFWNDEIDLPSDIIYEYGEAV